MNPLNIALVVIGVIIFALSFLVNTQPAAAIMWFVGVILVIIGLSMKKKKDTK